MATTTHTRVKKAQRGQTIILVAIALASLVAMAALAIDVVTLYSARSEAQNAADAAALAGAKSFVDTGVTTDPTNLTLKTLAQATATPNTGKENRKIRSLNSYRHLGVPIRGEIKSRRSD